MILEKRREISTKYTRREKIKITADRLVIGGDLPNPHKHTRRNTNPPIVIV